MKAKNHLTNPPVVHGRRAIDAYHAWHLPGGPLFRLEFVPCGSRQCTKIPDEHGPLWYRYERVEKKWRITYVGRIRNLLSVMRPPTLAKVRNKLQPLLDKISFTDNELDEMRELLFDLHWVIDVEGASGDSTTLRNTIGEKINSEHKRREEAIRELRKKLLQKVSAGEQLTKKEILDFNRTSDILCQLG